MKRIRITHVLANTLDRGAQWMVLNLLEHLDDMFESSVVSLREPKGSTVEERFGSSNIPVRYLRKKDGFDLRLFGRMRTTIRELNPDILNTHRIALRYTTPITRLLHIPHVHTVHSQLAESTSPVERLMIFAALKGGVLPVAVANSIGMGVSKLLREPPGSVPVIPNGIPLEAFSRARGRREAVRASFAFGPDDCVFVCVARLAYPKNQALLIKAFYPVVEKHRSARLVLVGDGPDRAALETLSADLGVARNVTFLGVREDVADILAASDVFVMTSDWEGYPLSLLEAAAAGLPAVSTDVGAISEIVRSDKTGILVPSQDESALTQAMMTMMGNARLRRTFSDAALNLAQGEFGLDKMAARYASLYREVVNGKR